METRQWGHGTAVRHHGTAGGVLGLRHSLWHGWGHTGQDGALGPGTHGRLLDGLLAAPAAVPHGLLVLPLLLLLQARSTVGQPTFPPPPAPPAAPSPAASLTHRAFSFLRSSASSRACSFLRGQGASEGARGERPWGAGASGSCCGSPCSEPRGTGGTGMGKLGVRWAGGPTMGTRGESAC